MNRLIFIKYLKKSVLKSLIAVFILFYISTGCLVLRDKEAEKEIVIYKNLGMCLAYIDNPQFADIISPEQTCLVIWLMNEELEPEDPLVDSPYKFSGE